MRDGFGAIVAIAARGDTQARPDLQIGIGIALQGLDEIQLLLRRAVTGHGTRHVFDAERLGSAPQLLCIQVLSQHVEQIAPIICFQRAVQAFGFVRPMLEFVIGELADGFVALGRRKLLQRLIVVLEFFLGNVPIEEVLLQVGSDAIDGCIHAHVISPADQ